MVFSVYEWNFSFGHYVRRHHPVLSGTQPQRLSASKRFYYMAHKKMIARSSLFFFSSGASHWPQDWGCSTPRSQRKHTCKPPASAAASAQCVPHFFFAASVLTSYTPCQPCSAYSAKKKQTRSEITQAKSPQTTLVTFLIGFYQRVAVLFYYVM